MSQLKIKQYRAHCIVEFYRANSCDLKATLDHFKSDNVHPTTVRRAVKRYQQTGSTKFKPITGRPRTASTKEKVKLVDHYLKRDPDMATRKLAHKCSLFKSTADRIKHELGWKSYTKQQAPKMINDQGERIVRGATKIYKQIVPSGGSKIIVMDDETYVALDSDNIHGKSYYSQRPAFDTPIEKKLRHKTKFFKKYLVWQAIDQHGNVSKPYISTGTINAKVYLEKCLKKYLLPFIAQHHSVEQVLFWPDLASAHYAKDCTDWLEEQNIQFVSKRDNTPNWPQGRPIEKFWALCKREYSKRDRPATCLKNFRKIWCDISERVARESGKQLMTGIGSKLLSVREHGPLGPIKIKLPLRNRTNNNE